MSITKFKKKLAGHVRGAELIDWKACGIGSMTGGIAIDPAPTPVGQSDIIYSDNWYSRNKDIKVGQGEMGSDFAIDRTRRRLSPIRSNDA
ncbi:hypothetical protein [Sphingomonas faeni]|uniref:hypothetical protein n=1 Tax=Sphingomonas faeni TaxID=185950 RepID=UPI003345C0D2